MFLTVNPNEDIAENDPVRVVDAIVEGLDLKTRVRDKNRPEKVESAA